MNKFLKLKMFLAIEVMLLLIFALGFFITIGTSEIGCPAGSGAGFCIVRTYEVHLLPLPYGINYPSLALPAIFGFLVSGLSKLSPMISIFYLVIFIISAFLTKLKENKIHA